MPGKNATKVYVENGYYHIYNRGVEKRLIFQDEQDYNVFLTFLKDYLSPIDHPALLQKLSVPNISPREKNEILKLMQRNNFNQEITILVYCLMPNHFHFFIKQRNMLSIDKFMNSLGTRYTSYFNRKYERVGALYQDVYKAVLVTGERQFVHLSRYIHSQAISFQGGLFNNGQPSSYPEYLGERNTAWVHPEEILAFFSNTKPSLSYERFVAEYNANESIDGLNLEE